MQKRTIHSSDNTGAPGADPGLLACTYEPFIVGEHKIHVMYAGTEIPESPFVFESLPVGRADLCAIKGRLSNLPVGVKIRCHF